MTEAKNHETNPALSEGLIAGKHTSFEPSTISRLGRSAESPTRKKGRHLLQSNLFFLVVSHFRLETPSTARPSPTGQPIFTPTTMSVAEKAVSYAALILADDGVEVTVRICIFFLSMPYLDGFFPRRTA